MDVHRAAAIGEVLLRVERVLGGEAIGTERGGRGMGWVL